MPRTKDEVLSIRTTAEVKDLLQQAAQSEHRSLASMVEVLVYGYAKLHDIRAVSVKRPVAKGKAR